MAIFIPFLAALLIPFLYKRLSRLHIGWFVLAVPTILFIALVRYIPAIAKGKTYLHTFNWIPSFDINFITYLDGLSMILGLLITGIGALVVLYSIYYLSAEESLQHFYIYLLLFMGGMLGVVFTDHLMILYLFWELTSISSFLLNAFWYHRKGSRYGAKKSLLITVSGGFAMLAGFIMLYTITDTFSVREIIPIIANFKEHALFLPAMILLLLGAFTKSAQFPFHIWLPDAMEAPTPVSAYLHSATMVKAGIYLVARFTPIFGGEATWFWAVSGIGIFTLLWCSFQAIRQTDLKALLAYSTVSQLGFFMSLFGVGSIALYNGINNDLSLYTQATFAALFHLINHSTFKGALFMVIGIVDFQLGTRDIRRLGGLIAFMPISFTVALIGSFSMAGLPPFNGFLSKEMFFTAMLNVRSLDIFSLDSISVLFPVLAWVASLFTFVYSLIIVFKTFFGTYVEEESTAGFAQEPSPGMLVSPIILAILIVGIFFYPNLINQYMIQPAMGSIYPLLDIPEITITRWVGFNTEILMTLALVIGGILVYFALDQFKVIYRLFPDRWSLDTLYAASVDRMDTISKRMTTLYMSRYLRHYLVYIFITLIIFVGVIFIYTNAFQFSFGEDRSIQLFEWLLVFVMIAASLAIIFAKSRLTAILLNGVLGFSIAMFFVLFRAPDLALTQLVIETVTTVLFLLCFYFLPKWQEKTTGRTIDFKRLMLSIAVGAIFVITALAVNSERLFTTISTYFEQAYELTGGKNIVNTILADFRAFDTMLEVIVLFIAGIGVYSLIKIRQRKGANDIED